MQEEVTEIKQSLLLKYSMNAVRDLNFALTHLRRRTSQIIDARSWYQRYQVITQRIGIVGILCEERPL